MRLVVLALISMAVGCSLTLTGDNVCPETERYLVNVTRSVVKKIQTRHYKWCMSMPPRCSYYTEEERLVPETVEEEDFRTVHKCCPGFHEDNENQICISRCTLCKHGLCTLNDCVCDPGFEGDNCDKACESSNWGHNCEHICKCQHGKCSALSGYCSCEPGWTGEYCNVSLLTTIKVKDAPGETETTTKGIVKLVQQPLPAHNPTKYPTLQKYHTFLNTTHKPHLATVSNTRTTFVKVTTTNGRLNGIIRLEDRNVTNANLKNESAVAAPENLETTQKTYITNVQVVKEITNSPHNEVAVASSPKYLTEVSQKEDYPNNETDTENKNDLVIQYDQSPHLLFSVGAVIGISATIVFMIVALFVTRIYVKQKHASVISVVSKSTKSGSGNGVCIYTSSVFHSPSDTSTFDSPAFAAPTSYETNSNNFESSLHTQVVYSTMEIPTHSTFKQDPVHTNSYYDHPQTTGASVSELPLYQQCPEIPMESKEHLYDEIPCWTQPFNVMESDGTNMLLSYYENCKDIK